MFVGREIELAELTALWRKPVASLVTCRGRRRIGKSTLIQEFARISQARFVKIEGKPPEGKMSNRSQLDSFGEQLSAVTGRRADRFAIQTDRRVCIVEIKRKREIGCEIIDEVESKVRALDLSRDKTVRTALVYEGNLMPSVRAEEYFDAMVAFDDLLGLRFGCV